MRCPAPLRVGAYDAMGLISKLLEDSKRARSSTARKEMELLKGYSWESPRGKVTFRSDVSASRSRIS